MGARWYVTFVKLDDAGNAVKGGDDTVEADDAEAAVIVVKAKHAWADKVTGIYRQEDLPAQPTT